MGLQSKDLGLQSKDLSLGFLLWLWFEAWAVVELVVVGFLCIRLDFLVEVVVLVEGYWWVWIFDSFGIFGGGCGCGFLGFCRWWLWSWVWEHRLLCSLWVF